MIKAKKISTINDVRRFTLGKDSLWWNSSSKNYYTVREGGVDASVSVVWKVPLPPPYSWNVTIPVINKKIAKVGAFIDIGCEMGVGGAIRLEKRNDKNVYVKNKNTVALKGSGGVKFGFEAEILPDIETVKFKLQAFGEAKLSAEGQLNFYTDGTFNFTPEVYLEPLVAGFSGNIEAGGYVLFDNNIQWTLLDRINIYP